jgi:hypothetical protein
MIGRRIHHVDGADPYDELAEPGDYLGPISGYPGEIPAVFFLLPVDLMPAKKPDDWTDDEYALARKFKNLAHVCSPPHVFRECADGSLEIRESILVTCRWKGAEFTWHGYLDEGHSWRTA